MKLDRSNRNQPAPVLVRRVKRILIGRPKRTEDAPHERLPVWTGLAVFFSDALSSVAYGTEEILLVLITAGAAAAAYSLPIGIAIIGLVFVVSTSYNQTVRAYPSGGGAYVVSRDNLGELPGLVAGGALLTDYILTVAVSVAAGVAALASAFPGARGHETSLAVAAVMFITWMNLRGVRESGTFFALPTYGFIAILSMLIVMGLIRVARGDWHPIADPGQAFDFSGVSLLSSGGGLTVFLLLRAFASGTATLTGLEAVSNGVRAFAPPEAENAARTMTIGRTLLALTTAGILFLAFAFSALPREGETVLSQIAREVFGSGPAYYLVQLTTMLILFLAANTAFADFPRLLGLLARDGYVSRRLGNLNDTLVYGAGIGVLALVASLLLVVARGSTHHLIPLYAVGVFTAFTLSQSGMVVHWLRQRRTGGRHYLGSLIVNGLGALLSAVVLAIIAATKLVLGAWVVVIIIPTLVFYFLYVKDYYRRFLERVRALEDERMRIDVARRSKVIIAVGGLSPVIDHAMRVAHRLSDDITAVHVAIDPEYGDRIQKKWDVERHGGVKLVVLSSPYREVVPPLRRLLDRVLEENPGAIVNLLVPVVVTNEPFDAYLHNATANQILRELVYSEGVLLTIIPFFVNMADHPDGVVATYTDTGDGDRMP